MTRILDHTIRLLNHDVDYGGKTPGQYRFLVNGKDVKYISIESGVVPDEYRAFEPTVIDSLPALPPGDWNEAHVTIDPQSRQPFFTEMRKTQLAGITTIWHFRIVDYLELSSIGRLRSNILKVRHPSFDKPVVFKFAEFPGHIPWLEAETRAYRLIDGSGVGPRFLGHVAEAGRVIGFLVEYLDGERPAHAEDLEACRSALSKLHARGIRHGDTNKFNFVISDDGTATLIDFETTLEAGEEELRAEMDGLEESLRARSSHVDIRSDPTSLRTSDSAIELNIKF